MAEVVSVAVNENITTIVKSKRGPQLHEINMWVQKVLELNPHIGHPDRIYPNEKILVPDNLQEAVPDMKIWQNALGRIPPQLGFAPPMHYEIPVQVILPGDTIDKLAKQVFEESQYWNVPASVKRAVFLHNNPRLQLRLGIRSLPAGTLANMTPFMLPKADVNQWESSNPIFKVEYDQLKSEVKEIYTAIGPAPTYLLGQTIIKAKSQGAAVGLDDVASGMASGYVAAGAMTMAQVNGLLQEVTKDAVDKFGRGVVCSNKAVNLQKVERFLKAHPKYAQVMQHLKEIPRHLFPEADVAKVIADTKSPYANAKLFKKQIFMPTLKPHATKYMGTIKSALNSGSRVIKVASKGMYVVPIVLGICDVLSAPPKRKVQTLFEQGFGIIGGYGGALFGAQVIGLGIVALLGLGPLGLFFTVFICASAGGLIGAKFGKDLGKQAYDFGTQIGNGKIYTSLNQLFGSF